MSAILDRAPFGDRYASVRQSRGHRIVHARHDWPRHGGLSLVAALITAVLIGCPLALLSMWLQTCRTLRALNGAERPSA